MVVLVVLTSRVAAETQLNQVYVVGNSLSWDLRPSSIDSTAHRSGVVESETGYHIQCRWGPVNIWMHPEPTCISPRPSTWNVAIPEGNWDALSFQLHHGPDNVENLGLQAQAIIGMYTAARQSTNPVLMIYTAPPRLSWNLLGMWEAPSIDADTTPYWYSEEYVDNLEARLRAALPATRILRIDGPQLQLDLLESGLVTDRSQLYRDNIHSSLMGSWVGHVAHLELRYGPHEWRIEDGPFQTLDSEWTRETTVVIRNSLNAANANEYADYNGNGIVDAADYNVWRDNFRSLEDLRADGNMNGIIDAPDYNVWRDNFGNVAAASSIPEPATIVLLVAAVFTAQRRQRRPAA